MVMAAPVVATGIQANRAAVDRATIDAWLDGILPPVADNPVRDAMRYAVIDGGQRLRPLLSLRVARMVQADHPAVLSAAGAVELVHCASLIVDDLPCMDDSATRRGRPCVHLVYGEPVALLAAFSLIALAGRLPVEQGPRDSLPALVRFQRKLLSTLDCGSLVAGQVLDLATRGADRLRQSEAISDLKTVPLFRIAMEAGALLADLTADQQVALDSFGREFGLAYQLVDDLLDGELDDPAPIRLRLLRARAALAPFGRASEHMEEMLDYLDGKTLQAHHRSR